MKSHNSLMQVMQWSCAVANSNETSYSCFLTRANLLQHSVHGGSPLHLRHNSIFACKHSTINWPFSQNQNTEQGIVYSCTVLLPMLPLRECCPQYWCCWSLFAQCTQACCPAVGRWSTPQSDVSTGPVLLECNWICPRSQHQSQPTWQTRWATWPLG